MRAGNLVNWGLGYQTAFCLILLSLAPAIIVAEQLPIRIYTTADGLAHSRVNHIHQDAKGYLWFGTVEGLSRFDGYRVINYGPHDGLGHPYINTIAEDRQGRLWVGTNGGGVSRLLDDPQESRRPLSVARSDKQRARPKFISFSIDGPPGSNAVNQMLFDANNTLWCITDAALYRATLGPDSIPRFEVVVPQKSFSSSAAFADSQGRLWFGLEHNLIEVVEGRIITYAADEVGRDLITSIIEDRRGRVLVSNRRALFEFITEANRRGRWKRLPLTLAPNQWLGPMVADADGTLWIGTNQGLMKYQGGKQVLYTTTQGLSDNNINCLSFDRDGNLWIGTWSSGACKLSGEMIISFTKAEGLPGQFVHKVIEDGQGRIYASIGGGGLVEIVDGKVVPVPGSQRPPFNTIYDRIVQDRRGDWWVGTEEGLFRFQGPELQLRRGKKLTPADGISEASIAGVYEDPTGRVWIGSGDGHLYWFDPTPSRRVVVGAIPLRTISPFDVVLTESDRSRAIWFGSHRRLGRLMNGTITMLQPTDGLPETDPRDFFQDSRGWLWIGLRYKGVSMTKNPTAEHPTFVNYSTANGLASDTVWAITEDDVGRIYFGTGRGLDRLDLATGHIRHFTTADGLVGDQVNHCLKDRQGNIWVATTGLSRVNPRSERPPTEPPPIYVSRVQVAGEDLPLAETGATLIPPMELSSSRNNLLIEYVGLSFQGEQALNYQYKLEGVDADWSLPTDQRTVNYAKLSPGTYRFMVRAVNSDGTPSPTPASVTFTILPPMWQRWWFLILAAMAVGFVVYFVHRVHVARLIELERVRTRIATDLHDEIGSNLSLIAMIGEVANRHVPSDDSQMAGWLSLMASTSRETMDSMSDIVWAVNPQKDHLNDLIQRMRRVADDNFSARNIAFQFNVPGRETDIKLGAETRREIFKIFKESINNIVRHAQCTRAAIEFQVKAGWLVLEVSDNGQGFDRDRASEGNGLMSMRRRAANLGGELKVISQPGRGTTVLLRVPLEGHRK